MWQTRETGDRVFALPRASALSVSGGKGEMEMQLISHRGVKARATHPSLFHSCVKISPLQLEILLFPVDLHCDSGSNSTFRFLLPIFNVMQFMIDKKNNEYLRGSFFKGALL